MGSSVSLPCKKVNGSNHSVIIPGMSWIDDDAAELQRQRESAAELAARNSQIANCAEKIYNDLWTELVARIAEAKSKGNYNAAELITNGDPYERRIFNHRIVVPQPVKPGTSSSSPKYVVVKLVADHLKIEVAGLRKTPIYLLLDICDDGVVLPKYEGECKTIQEAAKLILRPVIYPELFPMTD
ncbi:MAG: hypothetical protein WB799_23260 [Candidatus Sulfotelmatobacter sp.]